MKKLVELCVGLIMIIVGSVVVAQQRRRKTEVIKTHETATFVSANFDSDNGVLGDPASYLNGEGISNAGTMASVKIIEFAPDGSNDSAGCSF